MRVAVFSDTHWQLFNLDAALSRAGALDAFLHLGDDGSDAERIAARLNVPWYAVRGNTDFGSALPKERVAELGGARLLLTHGDAYVSTFALASKAEEQRCKAVLFGHTHTPLLTAYGAVLILNPGSLSLPRNGSAPSFAVLTIEDGDVNAKMISL